MKLVVDTSVIISVVTNESHKKILIDMTRNASFIAPESLHYEIGNAFSAMFKRNRIPLNTALEAIRYYEEIPIQFCPVDLDKSLQIADQLRIYACDAYFIECAERNRSPLLSIDEGLIGASRKYGIKVMEVKS